MTTKSKIFIDWALAGLIGFLFIGSAISKLTGGEEILTMAKGIGLDLATFKTLAVLELLSVIFFIVPRTGILGTLLLAAYMGGGIATHLEHGQSIVIPVAIQTFIWVAAVVRFPELTNRIRNKWKP